MDLLVTLIKNHTGLILRENKPLNLEAPREALRPFATANQDFYVRNHFDVPDIAAESWSLAVQGAVHRPFELDLYDIRAMESTTVISVMECAGNGRAYVIPKAKGAPWAAGAVGNAEWTGVTLSTLLDRGGLTKLANLLGNCGAPERTRP